MDSFRTIARFWYFILPFTGIFVGSLVLALAIRPLGLPATSEVGLFESFATVFILWLIVFFIHGLIDIEIFTTITGFLSRLSSAMLANIVIAVLYFYFQPDLSLTPRRFLLLVAGLSALGVLVWILSIRYFVLPRLRQHIYTFGTNAELATIINAIRVHDFGRFHFAGTVTEAELDANSGSWRGAGVILPDTHTLSEAQVVKLQTLGNRGIQFYPHRFFYEQLLRRVPVTTLHPAWFLENISYRRRRIYDGLKRCIDILLGCGIGIVFVITFPVIALLLYFGSRGPIFFKQERVGQHNRIFTVYKYRTMTRGATNTWTAPGDTRITRVGNVLRRLRLDELPQALNIILGNMSVVGPRPEQPHLVKELESIIPFYGERHTVKPGLTGWAQLHVYAATVEETKLKLEYDLYYIKHRSLLFDIEIILKTIYSVLTWTGR